LLCVSALAIALRGGFAAAAARRAERRQRALVQALLHSTAEGVITTGEDGRITSINDEAQRLTGWSAEDAINRPLDEVFRGIDSNTLAPAAPPPAQVVAGHPLAALPKATALIRKDGTVRDIDERVAPIRSDRDTLSGCLVVLHDATEDHRLRRMVAHQQHVSRLCASIIESSNDAILSHTLTGIVDSWNGAAEELFGYPASEIIGQPVALLVPRELEEDGAHLVTRIASGERVEHHVTQRLCADGRRVHVSLTLSPIRNNDAHIVGVSIIARDVTSRVDADHRERELRAETARLVEELRLAERRSRDSVGELAQDLLDPLAAIVNAAHLIQEHRSNAQQLGAAANTLIVEAAVMRELIEELVDATHVTQGRVGLSIERVDVAALIDEAAQAARTSGCQALVIVARASQPVYVNADRARITQIIHNLLTQAGKFTTADDEIHIALAREPGAVAITIRDSGLGAEPEPPSRVVRMFDRPERFSPRRRGLGDLAVVTSLVHLHGGTVTVDPGLWRGWTVRVRLPA
jgi:two-component system CheB/CheR fusion protein